MNTPIIKGNWIEQKGKLIERFANLTFPFKKRIITMNTETRTNYDPEQFLHFAILNPPHNDVIFSIQIENYENKEDIDLLEVVLYSKDSKKPFFQFYFSERLKNEKNIDLASFIIPLDHREVKPPYTLSIFADTEEVNLEKYQFHITWKSAFNV